MTTLINTFSATINWFAGWAGNGHTADTDPINKGWKIKIVKNHPELVVLGRITDGAQCEGCASIRQIGDTLDVAIYGYETPKEVVECFDNAGIEGLYHLIPDTPGWGLRVIRLIEAEVADR